MGKLTPQANKIIEKHINQIETFLKEFMEEKGITKEDLAKHGTVEYDPMNKGHLYKYRNEVIIEITPVKIIEKEGSPVIQQDIIPKYKEG